MVVFIWIACFFALAVLQAFLTNAGIILGGIPTALLYMGTYMIAKGLAQSWRDKHGK